MWTGRGSPREKTWLPTAAFPPAVESYSSYCSLQSTPSAISAWA
jgi:hypothetical protein